MTFILVSSSYSFSMLFYTLPTLAKKQHKPVFSWSPTSWLNSLLGNMLKMYLKYKTKSWLCTALLYFTTLVYVNGLFHVSSEKLIIKFTSCMFFAVKVHRVRYTIWS
jgi:hypothetical protein